jgi:hypothetical protein
MASSESGACTADPAVKKRLAAASTESITGSYLPLEETPDNDGEVR